MNNPYAPPTGDLSPVIDVVPTADRCMVESDKGKIEVAKNGEQVLVRHGDITKEIAGSKLAANMQLLFWTKKRINFKPLGLNVAVSDGDFAALLEFVGRERYMASDLRQLRIINLLLGVMLSLLGVFSLSQGVTLRDVALFTIGALMLSLFALSFTRMFVFSYLAHSTINAGFFLLVAWNLATGQSGWWAAIIIAFTTIAFWNNLAKFRYFSRA